MKKIILSLLVIMMSTAINAKSWKIGPSSVVGMDFASINAAMSSSNVTPGDTLYLDQYYNEAAAQSVSKKVVIIGTGYDTSLTDEGVVATLNSTLNLNADNVEIKSVKLICSVYFYSKDCILDRCYINGTITSGVTTINMNHIYSCYIYLNRDTSPYAYEICGYFNGTNQYNTSLDLQNNVIYLSRSLSGSGGLLHSIHHLRNSIINNNIIYRSFQNTSTSSLSSYYALSDITNSQITNNVIYGYYSSSSSGYNQDLAAGVYASGSGNTIEHNILSHTSSLSNYPNNKYNYNGQSGKWSELFTATSGGYSNNYQLAEGSAAKGYATDGGDCGCHGGMFGNPAGGRPQYIPYFTKVTVGSRSENGKLPVSIKVSIQDE